MFQYAVTSRSSSLALFFLECFLSAQDLGGKRNNGAAEKEIENIFTRGLIKSFLHGCATSGKPRDHGKYATEQ